MFFLKVSLVYLDSITTVDKQNLVKYFAILYLLLILKNKYYVLRIE